VRKTYSSESSLGNPAHIAPWRSINGLIARRIHRAMPWNVFSTSKDLGCTFELLQPITRLFELTYHQFPPCLASGLPARPPFQMTARTTWWLGRKEVPKFKRRVNNWTRSWHVISRASELREKINVVNDTGMQTRAGKWDGYVRVRVRVRIIVPPRNPYPSGGFTGYQGQRRFSLSGETSTQIMYGC
jgi:hypothetical protein